MIAPPSTLGFVESVIRELALWASVIFFLASGVSLYIGWKQRQKAAVLSETARSDVGDVQSPGVARVRGTVVPKAEGETFTSPIKGDQTCVLCAWEIEEMDDTPKTRSWESTAWGVESTPFYLEDTTGRLLVDIDDRTVGNETEEVFTPERLLVSDGVSMAGLQCEFETFDCHIQTGYDESAPPRVRQFVASTDGISLHPMTTEYVVDATKRKYYEQTVQQGDTVSILGYVTNQGPSADPEELIVTQSEESALHLSTQSFDDTAGGGGSLLFGIVTGMVGIALMLISSGL